MEPERNEVHVGTEASRAGSTPHVVRWILFIGLFLAIGLLTIIWVTGALTQDNIEEERQVTEILESRDRLEGEDPAIIISDEAGEMDRAPEINDPDSEALDVIENETEE